MEVGIFPLKSIWSFNDRLTASVTEGLLAAFCANSLPCAIILQTFLEMEQASSRIFGGLAPPYSPCSLLKLISALTLCCTVLFSRSQNEYSCPRRKMLPNLCMAPSPGTSCCFSVCYHQWSLAGSTAIPLSMFETYTLSLFLQGFCRRSWLIESTQAFTTPWADGGTFSRSLSTHGSQKKQGLHQAMVWISHTPTCTVARTWSCCVAKFFIKPQEKDKFLHISISTTSSYPRG